MPSCESLYLKALEIKNTLYPLLRTVNITDTIMPDDYNIPYSIIKNLLESVGKTPSIPHRVINMYDNVEATHISDLREICYELWMYIYQKLRDPYTDDSDFPRLKDILDNMRVPKHGDELTIQEWNAISDFTRRIVDLVLRYPTGFLENWNNWNRVLENWFLDYEGYLDSSTYVSPPSSYTAPSQPFLDSQCVLVNPKYINTPYVMIETWAKTKGDWGEKGGALGFLFRCPFRTTGLYEEYEVENEWWYGLYFSYSSYVLFFDTYQNKCKVYWLESETSFITLIGETYLINKPSHANVWNRYRAFLRKSGSGVNIGLEYWNGAQWIPMASFYHNSDTFWEGYDYYHGVSIPALYKEFIEGKWVQKDARTWIDDTLIIKI